MIRADKSKITLERARTPLAVIWFVLIFLILAVLFAQMVGGRFGQNAWKPVFDWFGPLVSTYLGMIVYTLVSDASNPDGSKKYVPRSLWIMTSIVSIAYLISILAVILSYPFALQSQPELPPLDWLRDSGTFLTIIGAVSMGLMAAFFIEAK